ncbi:MAG: UTP--glucose-1-phosphate uridylyltransferase GalU [Paenibacillaceae bacterium]
MSIRKAIIPAAGLGTRFLPATKAQPKEMLPIVDKPAIQYIVEEAIASGVEDIIIVTGRNKRAIEDHFDRSVELEMMLAEKEKQDLLSLVEDIGRMADIHYIRQKEPLGLGHAVLCARKFIGNEPFAVLLGDDIMQSDPPCLAQMIRLYEQSHSPVVAVSKVPYEDVSKYGIISPVTGPSFDQVSGESIRIADLVEKPGRDEAPSNLAIIGRYILDPSVFEILENSVPSRGGEIQLTDALRELNLTHPMLAFLYSGKRYDVGDKFGFIQATIELALQKEELEADLKAYLTKIVERWK